MLNQRGFRLFSMIALLSIMLNTLMPIASQAVDVALIKAGADVGDWMEICSGNRPIWIRLAADGHVIEKSTSRPESVPSHVKIDHCGYCLPHAASFALPPFPLLIFLIDQETAQIRAFQSLAIARQVAWVAPAVRAPPSSMPA
ncbi:DUF2946 domain-containing protein [Undibacterium sp. MH2W]|uniref:DUF2946 domain-containing protein n=1 Tax=Undibacterium sp. MH2W TaxID=3413044 RepID=UPI003BF34415